MDRVKTNLKTCRSKGSTLYNDIRTNRITNRLRSNSQRHSRSIFQVMPNVNGARELFRFERCNEFVPFFFVRSQCEQAVDFGHICRIQQLEDFHCVVMFELNRIFLITPMRHRRQKRTHSLQRIDAIDSSGFEFKRKPKGFGPVLLFAPTHVVIVFVLVALNKKTAWEMTEQNQGINKRTERTSFSLHFPTPQKLVVHDFMSFGGTDNS
jgi:hypothetical protein